MPSGECSTSSCEPLADVGGDPRHLAGSRDVGHDAEEARHVGFGHEHGPHENAVHGPRRGPRTPGSARSSPRSTPALTVSTMGASTASPSSSAAHVTAVGPRGHPVGAARGVGAQQAGERGVPDDTGAGGGELPHDRIGEVGHRGQVPGTLRDVFQDPRAHERGRGANRTHSCLSHVVPIGAQEGDLDFRHNGRALRVRITRNVVGDPVRASDSVGTCPPGGPAARRRRVVSHHYMRGVMTAITPACWGWHRFPQQRTKKPHPPLYEHVPPVLG